MPSTQYTREQYCELYDIPFKSLRQWPQDVAKAEKRARAPEIIPVSVSGAPGMADGRPLSDEPVTLFLPGGIRMCCQPSQLTGLTTKILCLVHLRITVKEIGNIDGDRFASVSQNRF